MWWCSHVIAFPSSTACTTFVPRGLRRCDRSTTGLARWSAISCLSLLELTRDYRDHRASPVVDLSHLRRPRGTKRGASCGGWECDHMAAPPHGSCRMGDNPKTSVTDRNLRVHQSPNLYVAGSAVFVTSGASNPTLTIAALSHRLADCLSGEAAVSSKQRSRYNNAPHRSLAHAMGRLITLPRDSLRRKLRRFGFTPMRVSQSRASEIPS